MSELSLPRRQPIAIVGVGALTPGAAGAPQFWGAVLAGDDLIGNVPADRWDPGDYFDADPGAADRVYSKRGAFLDEVDFDPLSFGIPPATLPATDTSQLLALKVAEQVLSDAGVPENARERVGVILGTAALELLQTMSNRMQRPVWLRAMLESGVSADRAEAICDRIAGSYAPWQEMSFPGLLSNVVAGRVANRFDLHGPNYTTDAACAGSLAAVASAVNELTLGNADLMITGGVDTLNDILMYKCFSAARALSRSGDCRPFAAGADGTMLGEAVVMFALKRLADAEADGDQIYAVIRGLGSSSDGRGSAVYAPVAAGQARALRRAYAMAEYGPESVELVEAHGTGTAVGDVTEFNALNSVFDESGREDRQWCALGSAKSQFGHTKSAAGAVGMLKAVLALRHKVLPPTIKVDEPNPALDMQNSPLYLNTRARPWIRDSAHPRRASVSSFGFGGTNFHVTLEEHVPRGGPAPAWFAKAPTELIVLAAESTGELVDALQAMTDRCRSAGEVTTAAREAAATFRADAPVRGCLIVRDADDLAGQVVQLAELVRHRPAGVLTTPAGLCLDPVPATPGRVAFLFSGQGSQRVDMGADLAVHLPVARECWDRAADLRRDGKALHSVVFPPPAFTDEERTAQQELLTRTEWAQPALAVNGTAMLAVLRSFGLAPSCVAGHSLGELLALHAAGVFDEATLVQLAAGRGELMRAAATDSGAGAMLAIETPAEDAARYVEEFAGRIWLANLNGPRQTVVSGHAEAIAELGARLAERGVGARLLQASGAFHTPMVEDARDPFAKLLKDCAFFSPEVEVYGNANAAQYPSEPDEIRRTLADHLISPVRFSDQIRAMHDDGARIFVEVGAGTTLTRLTSGVLGDQPHLTLALDRPGTHGITALQRALGRLAVAGVTLELSPLWTDTTAAPVQPQPPRMSVRISGANYREPAALTEEPTMTTQLRPVNEPERTPQPQVPFPVASQTAPPPLAPPVQEASVRPSPAPSSPPPLVPASPPNRPSPTAVTSSTPRPTGQPGWLGPFEQVQHQAADAHAEYQRLMAETHLTYLRFAENSVRLFFGAAVDAGAPEAASATELPHPQPRSEVQAGPEPQRLVPPAMYPPETEAPRPDTAVPSVLDSPQTLSAVPAVVSPAPSVSAPTSAVDLESVLFDVVAEKTGYPRAILESHLELETDLGVDSIKRVEILSLLRSRLPHVPEVDANRLAELRTLGEIAACYASSVDADVVSAPRNPSPVMGASGVNGSGSGQVQAPVSGWASGDLESVLFDVVAEKTGYPRAILESHLELETDLGVDSIKRVEILSLLRSRLPHVPEVDANRLAELRTLGEIAACYASSVDADVVSAPRNPSPVMRAVTKMIPAVAPGLEIPGLREGSVAVADGGSGLAAVVVRNLRDHGVDAVAESSPRQGTRALVLLDGLRPVESVEKAIEVNRDVFVAVCAAAKQFTTAERTLVVVQDNGGDFGLSGAGHRAWLGGLAGLARSVKREWRSGVAKALDVERGERSAEDIAEAIVTELLRGGTSQDIGLRADGTRWALRDEPCPAITDDPRRRTSQVLVVTGGARGVTAAGLLALAADEHPSVALLGRTELAEEPRELEGITTELELRRRIAALPAADSTSRPGPAEIGAMVRNILASREIRATVAALEQAGCTVRYLAVDVRDQAAVQAAIDEVHAQLGPITGLVHGAGVLADARLELKTDEQFDAVFSTKVAGLASLLAATKTDPLDLVCVFSSVAGRFGNNGQSDYAMANEVLACVASDVAARMPDCLVRSIAWGPWDGGMVGPELREHFTSRGVPLIDQAEGAEAFRREMNAGREHVRVTLKAVDRLTGDVYGGFGEDVLGSDSSEEKPTTIGAVMLTQQSHPHLRDHAIGGAPVLPVVLALEWFFGAAQAVMEGEDIPIVLRNVEVVRGVQLPNLDSSGHRLAVRAHRVGDDSALRLELTNDDGRLCYRAVAEMAAPERNTAWSGMDSLPPAADDDPYQGTVLFHGTAFQSLGKLRGLSARGASATVCGVEDLDGWPLDRWHTDPAALDGALQLALLWAAEASGAAHLPMSVAEVRVLVPDLLTGELSCAVRAVDADPVRPVCDVAVFSPDGEVVAELLQVGLVRRPAGKRVSE